MVWRAIHGAAYQYDQRSHLLTGYDADTFCHFLVFISWVLPCRDCRDSYTRYISDFLRLDDQGKRPIDEYFSQYGYVQELACKIHDMVNIKLGKPIFNNPELAMRRSEVWSAEFTAKELFGILFIIALNYDSNGEEDKLSHYVNFYRIIPDFCDSLGHQRTARALEESGVGVVQPIEKDFQNRLVHMLYDALRRWYGDSPVPCLESVIERYALCRSAG